MLGIGANICYGPEAPASQKARLQGAGTPRLQDFPKGQLPKVNSLDSANFRMSDGTTKKPGFIDKIFGRHGSLDRSTDGGDNIEESRNFDPIDSLQLQPCPFIRPVPGKRMVARDEPNHILSISRTSPVPHGNTSIGRCRERAEAAINESTISDPEATINESTISEPEATSDESTISEPEWHSYKEQSSYDDSSQVEEDSDDYGISVDVGKQHDFVVLSSAPVGDTVAVADWTLYINFYSRGYLNLTGPPPPPTRGSTWEYLPAVWPPNEEARLDKHYDFDVLWPEWTQDEACALVTSAMARFQTEFASLSFFDSTYEIFKAENGYHTSRIERSKSIAAHVVLSKETMVVLDTAKDWRFENNPYVIGYPHIRFFAGAPMFASSGEIVGVFAVFSQEPRDVFSLTQRGELAELAALAMNDLTLQAASLIDPDFQTTPTTSRRQTQTNLFPEALRFQKPPSPILDEMDSSMQGRSNYSVRSSRDSGVLYMAGRKPKAHYRSCSADSSVSINDGNDEFQELMTPRDFRVPSHRPFSSSDLTSIDMPHPNSPNQSKFYIDGQENNHLNLNRLSRAISAMSMDDNNEELYADADDSILSCSIMTSSFLRTNPQVTTPPTQYETTITRTPSLQSMVTISTILSSQIGAPNDDDQEFDEDGSEGASPMEEVPIGGSKSGDNNLPIVGCVQTNFAQPFMAEAKFSCEFSASALGYDFIYAVEVIPARPFMAPHELSQPGGLTLTILAAHGLESTSVLSPDVHLQALRSRDGIASWTNLDLDDLRREGAYEFGVLKVLSLSKDYGEGCPSGVVFGAFKKPKFDSNGNLYPSVQHTTGVKAAAKAMKEIIFNYGGGPRRPSTDPTTPTSPASPISGTATTSSNNNRRSSTH